MVLAGCLVVLLALGVAEQLAGWRARRAVPIRIHVNGTRGKSTVTRLVAAALREAGIPTLAKVTGTSPRLILPDGREPAIERRAAASIREQGWLLRRAARLGARAVVAECMAVRPDLQWISERAFVRATIGVITNVRLDHTDVMGRSLEEVAASLANAIPRDAVLVSGEPRFASLLAGRCASLATRLVAVDTRAASAHGIEDMPPWLREDVHIALAVTRELGIDDVVAIRGVRAAAPDPGALTRGAATLGGHHVAWVDATAANDPESLDLLVEPITRLQPCDAAHGSCPVIAVYNHRADRSDRLHTFAAASAVFRSSSAVFVVGDRPALTLMATIRRLVPGREVTFLAGSRLVAGLGGAVHRLRAGPGECRPVLVFCGNTRGFTNPLGASCSKAPSASASR